MSKNYLNEKNCYKKTFLKKSKKNQDLINETLFILEELGIPVQSKTPRQKEKTALSFLVLGQVNTKKKWNKLQDNKTFQLNSKDVLRKINSSFKEKIKVGSYDDIRRTDLIELTNAGIVEFFPPGAKNNDPNRKFGISSEYAKVIRMYGSTKWEKQLQKIIKKHGKYSVDLNPKESLKELPIEISEEENILFSVDPHNQLQKQVIEIFRKRFSPNGKVLYVGDTDEKSKKNLEGELKAIKFFELKHDLLPDIIIFDKEKNWVFLIDAFHSTNPMSPNRVYKLKKMTKKCTAERIYVTAFKDLDSFRKQCANIAWETEVWIAEHPKNMIHYNGHKFLGPY